MNAIKLKRTAYQMQDFEHDIILYFLKQYFVYEIKDGNGSYLTQLNLDSIKFNWSESLFYQNDMTIFGAWTPLYKNEIFIQPNLYNEHLYNSFQQSDIFKQLDKYPTYLHEWNTYKFYQKTYEQENSIYAYIKDFNKFKFVQLLFETPLITPTMHQLYHKWQFNSTTLSPIFYIANQFISLFMGYEQAIKHEWTVEGDVYKNIDNQDTQRLVMNFNSVFGLIQQTYNYYKTKNLDVQKMKGLFSKYAIEAHYLFNVLKKYNILTDWMLEILEPMIG